VTPTRVAVLDIGTNSTRLLIADVSHDGSVRELDRRSHVTRLGAGVDATGRLEEAAIDRVTATLDEYAEAIRKHDASITTAVLTSAVRDAENGGEFLNLITARHGLEARVISGDEEAQLTFLGAVSERDPADTTPTLVIDVGGGSTELIVGAGRSVEFHVSLQIGAVRLTERHLHHDPPQRAELFTLARDARATIFKNVPDVVRRQARAAIAVAGTATSLAAIDQGLEPYDPDKVHGYRVPLSTCRLLLARLAALPEAERRRVPGLEPNRAPTIVAGTAILIEVLRAFELPAFEASEHDILRGAALRAAGVA
jgi:exopolyphosphatase/guanosine-5'-triphosphate,3'-diphosphate pyrophosphatase